MARKPKARADGEGTIYQEAPGKWRAELVVNGKKVSRTGKTRKVVAAKLAELKQARDLRLKVQDGRQLLKDWIAYWLDTIAPLEGMKLKTIEGHRWACDKYIIPHLGHLALADIEVSHIERWLQALAATPATGRDGAMLAHGTILVALRRLRTALNLAVARRAIPDNVARHVKTPVAPAQLADATPRHLEPDQVRQLLAAFAGHRLYALYALATTIGARQGELIGLRWSQVHLDAAEPRLVIREQLQRLKGTGGRRIIHREDTKSKRVRTVYLSVELVDILRAHRARQLQERLILGESWPGEDLVFTSVVGTALDGGRLLRQMKAGLVRAGLPEVTFHSLRHSAGSMMLAAGSQIVDVSEVLGHSSALVTARIYAHAFKEGQRQAVGAVSAILLRAG